MFRDIIKENNIGDENEHDSLRKNEIGTAVFFDR